MKATASGPAPMDGASLEPPSDAGPRIERLVGRVAIVGLLVAALLGLDQVLPPNEHVDVRWLALLLAVLSVAARLGFIAGVVTAVAAAVALGVWLLPPVQSGPNVAIQDVISLALFLGVSLLGSAATSRRRQVDGIPTRRHGEVSRLPPEALTQRELTILGLLDQGLSNVEIARRLYVSTNTVKTHLEHLYGKLGVASRGRAVAEARHLGLLRQGRQS